MHCDEPGVIHNIDEIRLHKMIFKIYLWRVISWILN